MASYRACTWELSIGGVCLTPTLGGEVAAAVVVGGGIESERVSTAVLWGAAISLGLLS